MSERPRTMTAEREAEVRASMSTDYDYGDVERISGEGQELLAELDAERVAHDSSEQKNIFLVGGVNQHPLRHCVWGFFWDRDRALDAVKNNESDLYEAGWYPLAVVAEAEPGLAGLPINLWWFEFNGTNYLPIKTPDWALRYGWMGFPELSGDSRVQTIREQCAKIAENLTLQWQGHEDTRSSIFRVVQQIAAAIRSGK